ncbi:MAG: translation initiation factor IF-3 [Acholeplasmatales bacterium]|nr:translation initiation factor IF-3 [Acholeplasmatales bacterium]
MSLLFCQRKKNKENRFIKPLNNYSKNKDEDYVNNSIPGTELLLIDENGEKLGIISKKEALRMAEERELDVVVVAKTASPMVAKLLDYKKFKYDSLKKEKEIKKNQHIVQLKEIRLSAVIEKHDVDTRLKLARKFLADGDKVKLAIKFVGRMLSKISVGTEIMSSFIKELSDISKVDAEPKMEGKWLLAILSPIQKK